MRRTLRLLRWLILALLAAPFVAFAAYDLIAFQPRMPDIRRLLAQAAPEENAPPESIRKVVRVSYPEHFSSHVARLLLQELNAVPTEGGMLCWHLAGIAWWALVGLHLSEPEQITLFLALSPMGNNMKGFAKASTAVVGVPLSAVSLEQAAHLVTIGKAPSYYLSNPEQLARHSQALVQRAKNAL
jgi:hypothetical protein